MITISATSPDDFLLGISRFSCEDESGQEGVITSFGFIFFTIDIYIPNKQ